MDRRDNKSHAVLNASISVKMIATSKKEALEVAKSHFNESKILMDQVKLVNELGAKHCFKVERIERMEWIAADFTEYSNRYSVIGQIRISISPIEMKDVSASVLQGAVYRLPRSMIFDRTNWTVHTRNGPLFTSVLSHNLEWKSAAAAQGNNVYVKVG